MQYFLLFVAILFVVPVSAQQSGFITDDDIESIIAEIESMLADEDRAMNSGDWVMTGTAPAITVSLLPELQVLRNSWSIVLRNVQEAISFIHGEGITRFGTVETFGADRNIRRDEVATMFARTYKIFVSDSVPALPARCSFEDLDQAHNDLVWIVRESCALWLFQWSNGRFLPRSTFTNAQALTVLVRMVAGQEPETGGTHWAQAYWITARQFGLTQGLAADNRTNLDQPITRGDVAKMLEAAVCFLEAKQALKPSAQQELVLTSSGYTLQARRADRMSQ